MADTRTVGEILRAGRLARGKSARDIGAKLDRSKATIKSWERDESDPDPDDLERLIGYYHLDPLEVAAAQAAAGFDDLPAEPVHASSAVPAEAPEAPGEPTAPDPLESRTGDIVVVAGVDDASPTGAEADVGADAETSAQPQVPGVDEAERVDTDATPVTPIVPAEPDPQGISTTPAEPRHRRGFFAAVRDPERPWLGYIRAFLTIVVLVGLAWLFMWAIRELFAAVGELRGSDSSEVQAWLGMLLIRTPG